MRREVTVAQHRKCVREGACPEPGKQDGCTFYEKSAESLPITCVTWSAATTYCANRGWRLPTEIEWEVAARGQGRPDFPWGNSAASCDNAALGGCGKGLAVPVGSLGKDRSWIGIDDLGGNVKEWTASTYEAYPGGTADPSNAGGRVTRGGSFLMKPGEAATSHTRGAEKPDKARTDLGFRCAVDL
jgi:formylglycine-generating enzyme required for sulfatase activity